MGIDLSKGYFFRTLGASKSMVTEDPISSSTMFTRLKYYLGLLYIDEGETPHGIRGTCAITFSGAATIRRNPQVMNRFEFEYNSEFALPKPGAMNFLHCQFHQRLPHVCL